MLGIETLDCTPAQVATGTVDWFDEESVGCKFKDLRLARRFRNLLEQVCDAVGGSIPLACQDWANTKAAYRFLRIPTKSAGDSERRRPRIPIEAGRGFR